MTEAAFAPDHLTDETLPDEDKVILDEPEAQSDLERVLAWLNSDLLLHRLYLVRDLTEHCRKIGFEECVKHIVPALPTLASDDEQAMRQALAEQIPPLATYFKSNGQEGYDLIISALIPILPKLLADEVAQVHEHAQVALPELAKMFEVEDVKKYIIPIVKDMAATTDEEEQRVSAAELLSTLSGVIPRELIIESLFPILFSLSTDNMFRVRKATAASLEGLTEHVGPDVTSEKLLPLLMDLSKDEIWGVRKACADSLVAISKQISNEDRVSQLVPLFQRLIDPSTETSRWVRTSAHQALGPFIATFPLKQVPSALVELFVNMAKYEKESEFGDSDYVQFAAFNFPAVLLTLGAEAWPSLSETFMSLSKDFQWKTRRTLSFSLHEIAKILGQKLTEEQLVPTFDLFLHDLDEVKLGVTTHFAAFLENLSPAKRKEFLPVLYEIQHSPGNWRFRKLIARQLGALAHLFDTDVAQREIVPFALALIADGVAAVRKNAQVGIGALVNALASSSERQAEFLTSLKDLASDPSYQKRLNFTLLCGKLAESIDKELWMTYFKDLLVTLSSDKVPNIRIASARSISAIVKLDSYSQDAQLLETLEKLKQDPDRDVVLAAGGPDPGDRKSVV